MHRRTSRRLFTKGIVTALAAPLLLTPTTPLAANALSQNSGLRLDTFVVGGDNALWHKWFVNGAWSDWENLGGYCKIDVAAVSWGSDRMDVFVVNANEGISHRWFINGAWSDWEDLGGTIVNYIHATSWGPGRLDLFTMQGIFGTSKLTFPHRWFERNQWSAWQNLDPIPSINTVIAGGPGHFDMFGINYQQALIHRSFDNGSWSAWQNLGGYCLNYPFNAVSRGPDSWDVFVVNSDRRLSWRQYASGVVYDWINLDGILLDKQVWSGSAVASWGGSRLDLFAEGRDRALWHKWYDNGKWSGWESLGGACYSEPAAVGWYYSGV
jgi:hypothetical protein